MPPILLPHFRVRLCLAQSGKRRVGSPRPRLSNRIGKFLAKRRRGNSRDYGVRMPTPLSSRTSSTVTAPLPITPLASASTLLTAVSILAWTITLWSPAPRSSKTKKNALASSVSRTSSISSGVSRHPYQTGDSYLFRFATLLNNDLIRMNVIILPVPDSPPFLQTKFLGSFPPFLIWLYYDESNIQAISVVRVSNWN